MHATRDDESVEPTPSPEDAAHDVARAVEWAARSAYGRLIATLSVRTRDVAAAEDALSEAFQAALTQWPRRGVPDEPDGWLLTVARRRLADSGRRRVMAERAEPMLEYAAALHQTTSAGDAPVLPDQRAVLLFACAHPALDDALHAPLMLQVILGLEAERIAAAFLIRPSAMAQRLVRAKRKLRDAGVRFALPDEHELAERLPAVLEAIYGAFGTGWDDVEGGDALQASLADEAIWLARVLLAAFPRNAEVLGLLSLMRYCHARRAARYDSRGAYTPLDGQDISRWDASAIDEAEALLRRAAALRDPGRFQTEAAIQSLHIARRRGLPVAGAALCDLYDALHRFAPTVGVAVNRAAAYAADSREAEALRQLDALPAERCAEYQPWWALRAHILSASGRVADAQIAYDRAVGLTALSAVRAFLMERRSRLASPV